jgi:hypothetical protein
MAPHLGSQRWASSKSKTCALGKITSGDSEEQSQAESNNCKRHIDKEL